MILRVRFQVFSTVNNVYQLKYPCGSTSGDDLFFSNIYTFQYSVQCTNAVARQILLYSLPELYMDRSYHGTVNGGQDSLIDRYYCTVYGVQQTDR